MTFDSSLGIMDIPGPSSSGIDSWTVKQIDERLLQEFDVKVTGKREKKLEIGSLNLHFLPYVAFFNILKTFKTVFYSCRRKCP